MSNVYDIGWYGKLPVLGDFLWARLPAAFVDPWHMAMQTMLQANRRSSRTVPGQPWRFALAPGVCGRNGWIGTMLASEDRVGRRFPLTMAAPVPPHGGVMACDVAPTGWLDAASDLLCQVVDGQSTPAEFAGACRALRVANDNDAFARDWLQWPLPEGTSLWWQPAADAGVTPAWLMTTGLPKAEHATLLLAAAESVDEVETA